MRPYFKRNHRPDKDAVVIWILPITNNASARLCNKEKQSNPFETPTAEASSYHKWFFRCAPVCTSEKTLTGGRLGVRGAQRLVLAESTLEYPESPAALVARTR